MSDKKVKYVLGFAFDDCKVNVLLIKKNRPEWQKGLYNGVGGKIEPGETPLQAMDREAKEETGLELEWTQFATLKGYDFEIYVFKAFGEIYNAKQLTDEELNFINIMDIVLYGNVTFPVIRNAPLLVFSAMSTSDYKHIIMEY